MMAISTETAGNLNACQIYPNETYLSHERTHADSHVFCRKHT